jgi:hypothetical protein
LGWSVLLRFTRPFLLPSQKKKVKTGPGRYNTDPFHVVLQRRICSPILIFISFHFRSNEVVTLNEVCIECFKGGVGHLVGLPNPEEHAPLVDVEHHLLLPASDKRAHHLEEEVRVLRDEARQLKTQLQETNTQLQEAKTQLQEAVCSMEEMNQALQEAGCHMEEMNQAQIAALLREAVYKDRIASLLESNIVPSQNASTPCALDGDCPPVVHLCLSGNGSVEAARDEETSSTITRFEVIAPRPTTIQLERFEGREGSVDGTTAEGVDLARSEEESAEGDRDPAVYKMCILS